MGNELDKPLINLDKPTVVMLCKTIFNPTEAAKYLVTHSRGPIAVKFIVETNAVVNFIGAVRTAMSRIRQRMEKVHKAKRTNTPFPQFTVIHVDTETSADDRYSLVTLWRRRGSYRGSYAPIDPKILNEISEALDTVEGE